MKKNFEASKTSKIVVQAIEQQQNIYKMLALALLACGLPETLIFRQNNDWFAVLPLFLMLCWIATWFLSWYR